MPKGIYNVPKAFNEPVKSYAPGTKEREQVQAAFKEMYNSTVDVPLYIGSEEIRTGKTRNINPPFDHKRVVGTFHEGERKHIEQAIETALAAKPKWAAMAWEHRASIFLKAAELIAG